MNESWIQSATVRNGVSVFKATGIYPFCPPVIADHAFVLSHPAPEINVNEAIRSDNASHQIISEGSQEGIDLHETSIRRNNTTSTIPAVHFFPSANDIEAAGPSTGRTEEKAVTNLTPTKSLHHISPVPTLPEKKRKRTKQSACHATSNEFISIKKEKVIEKAKKEKKKTHRKTKRVLFNQETFESDEDEDLNSICLVCLSSHRLI